MTPNVNFDNYFTDNALPKDKRKYPFWKAWFLVLSSQFQRVYTIFSKYINGNSASLWSSASTYPIDIDVKYNYKIYKSLVSGNLNFTPDTNPDKWLKISDYAVGTSERMRYRGNKLIFEYALNKYFGTTFRQPNSPTAPTPSDIYITNVAPTYGSFLSFGNGTPDYLGDYVFDNYSTNFIFDDEIFSNASTHVFQINIPSAVYSAINSNSVIAEKIVRNFADKYVPSGISYIIDTY